MSMEPQSFFEIFNNRIYRIPDYQRGFSWGEAQLQDFWEDLVNLRDGVDHYTGMLTIQIVPREIYSQWNDEGWLLNRAKPYYIIDGQQRLTTFSIFVQCFCEYYRKLNKDKCDRDIAVLGGSMTLESIVKSFIKESNVTGLLTAYLFGYEKDNPSFEFLRHRIFGEPNSGTINETLYTHNLENAKLFFSQEIESFDKTNGFSETDKLFSKLLQNMKLIVYEIPESFDVFAAFETMNNRGKKLSNLELLKSRLIYLTSILDIQDDERRKLRKTINDCWMEVYGQLGRSERALSDDEFLRDHWITRYQYRAKRGEDYASFLLGKEFTIQNIPLSKKSAKVDLIDVSVDPRFVSEDFDEEDAFESAQLDVFEQESDTESGYLTAQYIIDYANSLKSSSLVWYATYYPNNAVFDLTEQERVWLERLGRLGFVYFRPLVVASFLQENSSAEERVTLFREIERFIFVVFRMSGAYATFNRNNTYAMARRVACGDLSVLDASATIRQRLENYCSAATVYDQGGFYRRLHSLFTTGDKTGFYGWVGLRYLLYEYEEHLVSQNGNAQKAASYFVTSKKDYVSIEHILPQTPTDPYWQDLFGGFFEDEMRSLTGSLGNLLLLSMSINSKLQNDSYPEKKKEKRDEDGNLLRRGYSSGSLSENEVCDRYEDWTAESILARGMDLLAFLEQRWDVHFENDEAKKKILHIDFL